MLVNGGSEASSVPHAMNTSSGDHCRDTFLIFEVCKRLNLTSATLHTACSLYHCVHKELKIYPSGIFNPASKHEIIGATVICLASKMEEMPLKIRDIVNVFYRVLHPDDLPLEIGEKYWHLRDTILNCELFLLRILHFHASFDKPHQFLLSYMNSLRSWVNPLDWKKAGVSQFAWNLLQDSFHLPISIEVKPELFSLAILKLAVDCTNLKIPAEGTTSFWWKAFYPDASEASLREIASRVLRVSIFEYERG